ncbi:MAG: 2-dehydro-3-deoxy-phosphogluconate aldolase, partial [Culicoidibacterales bacterium]
MNNTINFYKDRIALNVLTNSLTNAREILKATKGYVVVGILSAGYPDVETAIMGMRQYQEILGNAISVGLGAGNPQQWKAVAEIAGVIKPQHANQVFPAIGYTRAKVDNEDTFINTLVSPTGILGMVKITTGPLSSTGVEGIIPIEAAINLIKDMGGNSLKFFPMNGLATIEEYKIIAKSCSENNFALEPTGGINLDNFEKIVQIA